jgi:RNA polymerase sigma-70 factor (ECF subfamily)
MFFDNENFLVKKARSGDKKAFEALYFLYQKKVSHIIRRHVKNQEDIDDLGQIIFLKAYQGLKNFRGESTFFTWLFSIAMNCIKFHGKKVLNNGSFILSMTADHGAAAIDIEDCHANNPEAICIAMQQRMAIIEAIRVFPPFLREIFLLRESEGYSYAEIAVKMDCPVGTVKSRLHRVRVSMMKIMEKDEFSAYRKIDTRQRGKVRKSDLADEK